MSEKPNDGGPAFPHEGFDRGPGNIKGWPSSGMSLRDYFAGQALAGYFAAPNTPHQIATDCAAYIYEMADAMLAERGAK